VREAYSHEVSSAGFWPGGGAIEYPAFYSYAYPEPEGFRLTAVRPKAAFYSEELREFILPYDAVRTAESPDEMLLEFLQSTYEPPPALAIGTERRSNARSDKQAFHAWFHKSGGAIARSCVRHGDVCRDIHRFRTVVCDEHPFQQ